VWEAGLKPSHDVGLRPDGQVLDIRGVDIVSARLLSQIDIPVFVVTFRTQEIHVYRDIKTDEIKAGVEDRIQQVSPVSTVGVLTIIGHVCHVNDACWR
jgi:mitochondrial import inner membrane translocase subunit TIM44